MKILLTGYEGSKLIIPTSSWLWKKYTPASLEVEYLNFGSYNGKLHRAKYVELAEKQEGGKGAWGKYVREYVSSLKDRHVILGCDDFLINSPIDVPRYKELYKLIGDKTVAARLCDVTWYPKLQYNCNDRGIVSLGKKSDYLCTGQLTIWDRKALVELLDCGDIWGFESGGSVKMKQNDWNCVASYDPPFKYHTISALSGGDKRIDLSGVNEEDKKYIIDNLIEDGEVK